MAWNNHNRCNGMKRRNRTLWWQKHSQVPCIQWNVGTHKSAYHLHAYTHKGGCHRLSNCFILAPVLEPWCFRQFTSLWHHTAFMPHHSLHATPQPLRHTSLHTTPDSLHATPQSSHHTLHATPDSLHATPHRPHQPSSHTTHPSCHTIQLSSHTSQPSG